MPIRKITVACVQARAHDRDAFTTRLPEILALIERAAQHAQLVVAPEGTVPGYVIGTTPVDVEQIEQAAKAISAIAQRHRATIVYGTARIEGAHTYNSAAVLGPQGERLGHADKQFLWHFDRRWFARGETLDPVQTPHARLGVLVCADGRIPTIAATLVDRGAEILVMPTAWVTSGRDPTALENVQADLMAAIRAKENGVPFVAANKTGVEAGSVLYCGKSVIIDRDGTIVARAGERDESILFGEVEIGGTPAVRAAPLSAFTGTGGPARMRIAITPSDDPHEIVTLAASAALGDAELLIARADPQAPAEIPVLNIFDHPDAAAIERMGTLRIALLTSNVLRTPSALTAARLGGVDVFVSSALDTSAMTVAFARTRALELRAYVIVLSPERAFACDPDGVVLCGTLDDYRVASFPYDRARADQTLVAPRTDVLDGLRVARDIAAAQDPIQPS